MAKQKFYAVKEGRQTGIYNTWEECQKQVNDYKGAIYKSFLTKEEALAFLNGEEASLIPQSEYLAYVDGSYNPATEEYSFGAVLIEKDSIKKFKKKFGPDEYSKSRNVAGEIRGASFIINYCYKQGIKELDLVYDYTGIKNFYEGIWQANENLTKLYQNFANSMKGKIKVNFIKVKSHSNNYYNDIVDSLAKEALGI